MKRSRERHLSLQEGEVVGHMIPMIAFAELLQEWDAALRAALPNLVGAVGLTGEAAREALTTVQPVTSAPLPGSIRAPYGYAVVTSPDNLSFVAASTLDAMVDTFEAGVVALQTERRVPDWMAHRSARAILGAVVRTRKHGILVTFPDSADVVLRDDAVTVLQDFIKAEENGRESVIQVLGHITSVNVAQGYLSVDSAGCGRIRITLPQSERRSACQAMAEGEAVEVIVEASLSSDGALHNAKLRGFRALGARPRYASVFEELWGTARDIFAGLPRDERGIPEA